MEIILNYLDSMFAQLPDTAEVRKVKAEMASMMEDKYTELKAEGKSENEAVGTVIAEFGSIDELVSELDLGAEETAAGREAAKPAFGRGPAQSCSMQTQVQTPLQAQPLRKVSMEECRSYLTQLARSAKGIAIGVCMVILSVIFPISGELIFATEAAESVGAVFMFLMVAGAVALFIINGMAISRFNFLKNEEFRLEAGAEQVLRQMQENEHRSFVIKITAGVVLCILSVVPALLNSALQLVNEDWTACFIFAAVAAGVYLFITAGVRYGCYNVLLQKGEYTPSGKRKTNRAEGISDKVGSIYWPLIVAIYLGYSLITFDWARSWIIWPVAALLFVVITGIVRLLVKEPDC